MRLIDGDHLKQWIIARWIETDQASEYPLKAREILDQIDREMDDRPTGKWIKDRLPALNGGSYEAFRCSECKSAFNWRMKYCGHCGAKMDGGQNDG